jgi:hypothetical protein
MREPQPIFGTGFFYALIGGFFLAFFLMGVVSLGHCPGDIPETLACRAAQRRISLVYPLIYLAVTGYAAFRHRRGMEGATALAIFAGPLALVSVLLVNGSARQS